MADDTNIARKLNTEIPATRDAGQPRAGSPEPGARSPEPSARSRETGARSPEPGRRAPSVGLRRPLVGGALRRPEGARLSEHGEALSDARSPEPDVEAEVEAAAEEVRTDELWLLDPDRTSDMRSGDGVE